MKNGDARTYSAAVQDQTGCTHSLNCQSSGAGENGAAEDSPAQRNTHEFTSNGLPLEFTPSASAASAIVDVSWMLRGSSTRSARRSHAAVSAEMTSALTSRYAAAARINHAKLYADGQSTRARSQVNESRTI